MLETERALSRFMFEYLKKIVADLSDEQLRTAAIVGVNPPAWILSHIAIAYDFALAQFGKPKLCGDVWHRRFGPKSQPPANPADYPTKDELIAAIERGHAAVDAASRTATAELLAKPQPLDFLKPAISTVGELVAHLMATHLATHVGQLSTCRRALGKPPLF